MHDFIHNKIPKTNHDNLKNDNDHDDESVEVLAIYHSNQTFAKYVAEQTSSSITTTPSSSSSSSSSSADSATASATSPSTSSTAAAAVAITKQPHVRYAAVNLCELSAVEECVQAFQPHVVIHTAAFCNVSLSACTESS